jgi:hypothetical protein
MTGRTPARATSAALIVGTLAAVAVFAASFVLRLAGHPQPADVVGAAGVVVLLATPAVGLVTTALELRSVQRHVAALALVVLAVLGLAAAVAVAAAR